ncbi:MAG TPA: peptidylprolyl isomerase [Bacteroidota bacterium]|nr:peptidylprolyl isomerase [Bacteroidota bacterium]
MKHRFLIAMMFLFSFLVYSQTTIDRIVAVVDKEIITESEVQERINFVAMQNRVDPNTPGLRKQILDGLIAEKLILAQALIDSIVVSDDEVNRSLDIMVDNLIRQAGSQERVEQYYGMSINRIKREYRDERRKQMLVERVRQMREAAIQVTRREVEEFYESYRDSLPRVPEQYDISLIFVAPKPDTTLELQLRTKLQAILDSIRAGGDFAEFARRYSQDGTASSGGDLGWAKRGDYVRDFEEAVYRLREGEISNIIKTQFGFHIVQLIERRGESVHARHILLKLEKTPASDSTAVAKLQELRARALHGEAFADLARQYSEDEDTKMLGGHLGLVTLDQLEQQEVIQAIKDLKEGEISEPHRVRAGTSYGYQIILVKKRIPEHAMNLRDDYRRVEQLALYVKKNKVFQEWVEELKKSIFWELRS